MATPGKGMFGQFVALIEKADDADPADKAAGVPSDDDEDDRSVASPSPNTGSVPAAAADGLEAAPSTDGHAVSKDLHSNGQSDAGSEGSDPAASDDVRDGGGPSHGGAPVGLPGVVDAVDAPTIARLSVRLAAAETAAKKSETRARAAENTAAELTQLLQAKDAAIKRLLASRAAAADEGAEAEQEGKDEAEEARFEALAALDSTAAPQGPEAVQYREVVRSQAAALEAAYEELQRHRAQIVAVEAAVAEVEDRSKAAAAERDAAVDDAHRARSDLATTKKEVGRLSAKLAAMGATVDDLTAKNKAARTEVETALAQILRRDNELSLLRQTGGGGSGGGGASQSLRQEPVVQAMSKNKWGNRAVGFAEMLDVLMLRFGRLLRSHAMLRLIAILYVFVLHVYVFNAVMVFMHHSGQMPDHMGDDVHDHIANHVHH